MLAITPRPPSLIKRVWDAVARPPAATPYREMGVSGTAIYSGYVQNRETSPKWSGAQRYVTISDMAVNTSIIAAGVHYFLNLIAHPQWTVAPADDSVEARAAADLVESALHGMEIPWSRVVRRAGTFRFYGFGVQEWTAKKRADGSVGLSSVEPRPQATIERWVVADDGAVEGVWQRAPGTGALLGIPRKKFLYLVDDTLTDSPEGVGIFRHLAESWERLKVYYELEARAFERDLRGIPIGRVPYTLINQAVKDSQLTAAEAETLVRGMEDFVKLAVKKSDTSLTLDSMPYESQAADGRKVASVMQWGLELLQGSSSGVAELGAAITRTQYEMARVLTAEHLLMGESSGNRALSEDKSRNLYLVANSVLSDIAAGATTDIVARVCMLNGISEELYPRCEVEDVAFKDAESVAATLAKMAQAGAVLASDDPVVEDVRSLMGVSAPSPVSPEMAGLPAKSPTDEEVDEGWACDVAEEPLEKANPYHDERGRFAEGPGGEAGSRGTRGTPLGHELIRAELAELKILSARYANVVEDVAVVGSFGKDDPARAPDRRGPNTSDLDLRIIGRDPNSVSLLPGEKPYMRRFRVRDEVESVRQKIETKLTAISSRPIEVLVGDPISGEGHILLSSLLKKRSIPRLRSTAAKET